MKGAREILRLRAFLKKIAALDDEWANRKLEATGSYSSFDEPASVELARAALAGKELKDAQ